MRWAVMAAVVGLVLAACGGGGSDATFTAEDLGRIVLGPSEAPGATELVKSVTGQPAVSEPLDSPAVRALMAPDAGLVEAMYVEFKKPGPESDPDWEAAASLAIVFDDLGAAEAGYEVVLEDSRAYIARAAVEGSERSVEGLGDEGAVFEGEIFQDGLYGAFYVWRVGNLVLLGGATNFEPDEIRALADAMDSRAA